MADAVVRPAGRRPVGARRHSNRCVAGDRLRVARPARRRSATPRAGNSTLAALVLIELRLPRALLGCFVGFSLGISGAALQGLMRNPLAEPGIIGISGAAAFGAVAVFYFGLAGALSLALPLGGIAGAAAATFLLYALSGRGAGTMTLILAGVAINSFAGALTSLALNLSPNPYAVSEIVFWLLGFAGGPQPALGLAGAAHDGDRLGTADRLGARARRTDLGRGYGEEPRLRPRPPAVSADRRNRARGRQRGRGDRRDRLRRAGGAASAAAAGRPPAGTAPVRERPRRRGADAGGRHRRSRPPRSGPSSSSGS